MFRFWKGPDRQSSLIASWGTGVSSLAFPPRCPFCGSQIAEVQKPGLCPECREGIRWVTGPCCSRCGHPYPHGGGDHLCENCLRQPPFFDHARSLVAYQGPVAQAIQRFKYQKDFLLTASLAWLTEHYPWEENHSTSWSRSRCIGNGSGKGDLIKRCSWPGPVHPWLHGSSGPAPCGGSARPRPRSIGRQPNGLKMYPGPSRSPAPGRSRERILC